MIISGKLKGVHIINLFGYSKLTDQGLQYLSGKSALISGKLKGLNTINLEVCDQITNQGLQYLRENGSLVNKFNLKNDFYLIFQLIFYF